MYFWLKDVAMEHGGSDWNKKFRAWSLELRIDFPAVYPTRVADISSCVNSLRFKRSHFN